MEFRGRRDHEWDPRDTPSFDCERTPSCLDHEISSTRYIDSGINKNKTVLLPRAAGILYWIHIWYTIVESTTQLCIWGRHDRNTNTMRCSVVFVILVALGRCDLQHDTVHEPQLVPINADAMQSNLSMTPNITTPKNQSGRGNPLCSRDSIDGDGSVIHERSRPVLLFLFPSYCHRAGPGHNHRVDF